MNSLITPEYRRGCRNGWLLTAGAALFIVAFFYFTYRMNTPPPPQGWDMGGTAFVPASSDYANGYETAPAGNAAATKAAPQEKK